MGLISDLYLGEFRGVFGPYPTKRRRPAIRFGARASMAGMIRVLEDLLSLFQEREDPQALDPG